MNRFGIKKILADRALDDVLVNDPLGSLRCCLGIESTFRVYDYDRAECAQAKTAGLYDENVCKTLLFDLFLKRIRYLVAS